MYLYDKNVFDGAELCELMNLFILYIFGEK